MDHDPPAKSAYGGSSHAWAGGPGPIYDRLATELIACAPHSLTGAWVLDVGAGTGAASRAALEAGARVVAIDAAIDMVRWNRHARPPGVAGDAALLPFKAGSFDAVISAFVLSHLSDPVHALREAKRVCRSSGAVLASVFAAARSDPATAQVEAVAAGHGYRPPEWYLKMKTELEPGIGNRQKLERMARSAGFEHVEVTERKIDVGVKTPEELVRWRLGMAQFSSFLAALPDKRRAELFGEAINCVGPEPRRLLQFVLVLTALP